MPEPQAKTDHPQAALPDDLLIRFSTFIAARLGLNFRRDRRRHLAAAATAAAREMGFAETAEFILWLLSSPLSRSQIEILARHLTVGETYFFRDPEIFRLLEERILPKLLLSRRRSGRHLRIWSAGCATGEEPYSLAILLCRMLISPPEWNVTILGTDINPLALGRAAEGVYSEWSFRDAPPWLKEGYFRKRPDGHFEILPRLREMVTFSSLNLTENVYPCLANNTNAMDLILCRNVLMYFVPELTDRVVERFHNTLTDGGWLIVSPTETSLASSARLSAVHFPEAILFRKQEAAVKGPGMVFNEERPAARILPLQPPTVCPGEPLPDSRPLAAVPTPLPTADRLAEAQDLYGQGHYAGAAEKLEGLLAPRPDDPRALALLARCRANQGDFAAAGRWCEKAIAADKLDAGLRYLQALILEEQGAFDAAAEALKRTLYLDHGFVLAHFALGNLSRRQGDPARAEKHFRNALALLNACPPDEALPEAEGMTTGRLGEIIGTLLGHKGKA